MVSYKLFIVTTVISLTILPHFAIECLRRSNQQVTMQKNLGGRGRPM